MLKYVGEAKAVRSWPGPVTGTRYPFGPGGVGLVDKRDALVFLAPKGGGKAFKLYRGKE